MKEDLCYLKRYLVNTDLINTGYHSCNPFDLYTGSPIVWAACRGILGNSMVM